MDAAKKLSRQQKWADFLKLHMDAMNIANITELAHLAGLPATTLYSIREGKCGMTLKTAARLAPVLGVTVDALAEVELTEDVR